MNAKAYQEAVRMIRQKVQEMREMGATEILLSEKLVVNPEKKQAITLEDLAAKVNSCKNCPLGRTRIKAVLGQGDPKANVVFIGEGPGYEEDRQGLPFVGRAGKLLDKMMAAIDLDRQKVYICNVVKCHPMIDPLHPENRGNDRPPSWEEASKCLPYLYKQIEIIKPKIICVLGATAMRYVLGIDYAIGKARGRFFDFNGIKTLITYHPAALLRNPALKVKSWEDLKLLRDAIKEF